MGSVDSMLRIIFLNLVTGVKPQGWSTTLVLALTIHAMPTLPDAVTLLYTWQNYSVDLKKNAKPLLGGQKIVMYVAGKMERL